MYTKELHPLLPLFWDCGMSILQSQKILFDGRTKEKVNQTLVKWIENWSGKVTTVTLYSNQKAIYAWFNSAL